MNDSRRSFGTATLGDGRVLAAGGETVGGGKLSTAEIYSPATATWSTTASMGDAVRGPALVTISSSPSLTKVLRAGGTGIFGDLSSAEIYNSSTGLWAATGDLNDARSGFGRAVLGNGNVFITGGKSNSLFLTVSEEYVVSSGTWVTRPSMGTARTAFGLVRLPSNGKILAVGGSGLSGVYSIAELYTP